MINVSSCTSNCTSRLSTLLAKRIIIIKFDPFIKINSRLHDKLWNAYIVFGQDLDYCCFLLYYHNKNIYMSVTKVIYKKSILVYVIRSIVILIG
jgi:hypothetical protein